MSIKKKKKNKEYISDPVTIGPANNVATARVRTTALRNIYFS